MKTTVQTTGDLYQAWYDAVVAAFGLSPRTFLLARAQIPLGETSPDLWDYFDSVPFEDGHFYELQLFNRFSVGYGAVVNLLIPQSGTAWRIAVGEHYSQWVEYLASSPPIPPRGMRELFTAWAQENIPDPALAQAAITAYQQVLNDVVPVAQDRFNEAKGPYAYSRSIDEACDQTRRGTRIELLFTSSQSATPRREAASPFAAQLAGAELSLEARGHAERAAAKLAASHVAGGAVFAHQAQVCAAPLQAADVIGGEPYPPWFSEAALSYAYDNPCIAWPADMKPTWEQTFGPSGSLRRLVKSLLLVDGVEMTLVSDAELTDDEKTALQQAATAGFTPLLAVASPTWLRAAEAGSRAVVPLRLAFQEENGAIVIRISSPAGNVMLFGVVADTPQEGWRMAPPKIGACRLVNREPRREPEHADQAGLILSSPAFLKAGLGLGPGRWKNSLEIELPGRPSWMSV
ncbi:MAG TPA: hypothetical protein VGG20_12100 [Thermoanaerobaculia bacterium]|jgi:hypothetical protein